MPQLSQKIKGDKSIKPRCRNNLKSAKSFVPSFGQQAGRIKYRGNIQETTPRGNQLDLVKAKGT